MISRLFGTYLVNEGKLTASDLEKVIDAQKKVRVKLGIIAVSEKMMSKKQADEVNNLQAVMDKRFGDIAVEKGYLSEDQVGRLLGLQGNTYLSFVQAIVDNGFMTLDEIDNALAEYQKSEGFIGTDLEDLKSDDSDRIVPLYLPGYIDKNQEEHVLLAVRSLLRLVDSDIYVQKGYLADTLDCDYYAIQSLKGDKEASLAFAGYGDGLMGAAVKFGQERFGLNNLDALDAVAELINCINGMFAINHESQMSLEMIPPKYKAEKATLKGKMLVLPVIFKGITINLVSTFGEYLEV